MPVDRCAGYTRLAGSSQLDRTHPGQVELRLAEAAKTQSHQLRDHRNDAFRRLDTCIRRVEGTARRCARIDTPHAPQRDADGEQHHAGGYDDDERAQQELWHAEIVCPLTVGLPSFASAFDLPLYFVRQVSRPPVER